VGDRGIFKAGWQSLMSRHTKPREPEEPVKTHTSEETDPDSKVYSLNDITKFLGQSQGQAVVLGAQGGTASLDGKLDSGAVRKRGRLPEPVTARELAKDKLLNRLASEFAQDGLRDSLSLQDLAAAGLLKGEKALLPVNYVTIFTGCAVEEEEIVGTGQFAGRLIWQTGKGTSRRPTADKLSFGQFFEANSRILNLLDLDPEPYTQYLDYLRQVGILLQTFTSSSVFTLDHLHRTYVHETKAVWNIIENTLQNSVLKKKEDVAKQGYKGGQQAPRGDTRSMRSGAGVANQPKVIPTDAVCWLYNLPKGCFWGSKCIYSHVCSVDGCRQNHPACRHAEFTKGKQSA
jgi:hypothetical protein